MNFKSLYHNLVLDRMTILKRTLAGCDSILDLGCGNNSPIFYCKIPYSVGVDLYSPCLKKSRERKIHNKYIQADVREVDFEPKSFDAVMAFGIIEHLSKEDGYKFIKKMECWARKKIIISTPNGYIMQDDYDGNSLQKHISGWEINELQSLGFKIFGAKGLKWLRGYRGFVKYRPSFVWNKISDISQLITYRFPKLAFEIFAVKESK